MKLRAGMNVLEGVGLNLLTEDELYMIHDATMQVVSETGITVTTDEAQEIFEGAGCEVDRESKNVKIPAYLVEDAIRSTPSRFTLYGRDPKWDFDFGVGVNFTNFGEGIQVMDIETRKPHVTTKKDVCEATLMCDAMENIAFIERPVGADEVPGKVQSIHNAEAILNNTVKPAMLPGSNAYNSRKIAEMAAEIVGGMEQLQEKPIMFNCTCPKSPLTLNEDSTDIIIESAKLNVPINVLSMALAGATSPVTLAGTLVTHNAEVLAGILLAQLVRKGSRCVYGSSTTIMDMRSLTSPVGAPELAMISSAVATLGNFYRIPTFVAGG